MPNKPDYPDWRDTEPPKEDRPRRAGLYQQENKEKKGYTGLAADVVKEEKARKKRALDEAAEGL